MIASSRIPSDWLVTGLHPDIRVVTTPRPDSLDSQTITRVDAIWAEATRRYPTLYNGRVFSATVISADRIEGYWAEYRMVLAQMRAPDLFSTLQLRPLAVTGMLRLRDGFVFGQRNTKAIYHPGYWQGVPAGSVETRENEAPVELHEQLIAEIEEELGLHAQDVTLEPPLLACEHPGTHIVDIGMAIDTVLDFSAVHAAWAEHGNDEYAALKLMSPLEALACPDMLPTTIAMIEALTP